MKIELTETEIIHIMDSLRMRCQDLRDCDDAETADLANELEELEHDLFEASARRDDWTEDVEPTEIAEGFSFSVTENDFIQAGIDAREQSKASSRAAERRALNFSTVTVDSQRSETQQVDVWDDTDPKNW